ncbi:MAG: hypothetical protein QM734_01695 [Cyclobacteriaceae bacterium]
MKKYNPLIALFILSLAFTTGFSQGKKEEKKESKTEGLKKITPTRHWESDSFINEEALEINIEKSIESAMKSLDIAMEKMEVHMKSLELNMKDLDIDPIEINIPPIEINIPPIEIEPINAELHHLNKNINIEINRHIHRIHLWDDGDREKDRSEEEKTKGLKKLE